MPYDPQLLPEKQLFDAVEYHFLNTAGDFADISPQGVAQIEEVILEDPRHPIDYYISPTREHNGWLLECRPVFEEESISFPITDGVTIGSTRPRFLVQSDETHVFLSGEAVEVGTATVNMLLQGMMRILISESGSGPDEQEVLPPKTLQDQVFDIFWRAEAYDSAAKKADDVLDEPVNFIQYEAIDSTDSRTNLFPSGRLATIRAKDTRGDTGLYFCFEVDELGIPLVDTDVMCGIMSSEKEPWTTTYGDIWNLQDINLIIQGTDAMGLFPDDSVEHLNTTSLQLLASFLDTAEPYPVRKDEDS